MWLCGARTERTKRASATGGNDDEVMESTNAMADEPQVLNDGQVGAELGPQQRAPCFTCPHSGSCCGWASFRLRLSSPEAAHAANWA
eukprot:4321412-Amphidinium_carterae.2